MVWGHGALHDGRSLRFDNETIEGDITQSECIDLIYLFTVRHPILRHLDFPDISAVFAYGAIRRKLADSGDI